MQFIHFPDSRIYRRRDVPVLIFSNFACTLPDFEVKFSELLIFSVIFY